MTLTLPWSHRLPDYAKSGPLYGQNLVALAAAIDADDESLSMLDIGANVGDSALQVLAACPTSKILCVEADPYYLDFLRINVGQNHRVTVEESLLAAESTPAAGVRVRAVRSGGTTRFAEAEGSGVGVRSVTVADLRAMYPGFDQLRLVKSDTDGYDVHLVPAVARCWRDARPVLFFEYDHALSRKAGNDPVAVWAQLEELGYTDVAVWDHGGLPLGRTTVDAMPEFAIALDTPLGRRSQHYWDVAVVHQEDQVGKAAIVDLVPEVWTSDR